MGRRWRRTVAALFSLLLGVGGIVLMPQAAAAADPAYRVLVFSKTAGFRHSSIPNGIAAIQSLGAANNFTVTATEDANAFTPANLAQFKVVIWLNTTGDVLNATQQTAFEQYIQGGGGYVGVHSAADTEYDWPFYGQLVGAYFLSHPNIQQATIRVEDRTHASTSHLGATWVRTDEWYNFQTNPRSRVRVLATLDETTYTGGSMGADHPTSWCQSVSAGRSWYTGSGHTEASYTEGAFTAHLLGGIRYAAGWALHDCQPTQSGAPVGTFQQVNLAQGVPEVGEPMSMTVLPDRSVLHTARDGTVRITDAAGNTRVSGQIPVYTHDEEGMQGIAADPNFASNRFVYLYFAPPLSTPAGDAPAEGTAATFAPWNGVNRLARFTLNADGTLNLGSQVTVLEVPTSRGMCCHVGGDIDFDAAGNLYLSTGDDTNPFASDGYTPIDERTNRNPAFDAQRSAGNTNDLRGKLLRIKVNANGTYSIPPGNLFPPGTANTRPEIYAMGFRNPFRFTVDKPTGIVYLGEYGPDAGTASPTRGPGGLVEFNRITGPGNYGWPYCVGANLAYNDFTFPSGPSGGLFNCAGGPTNNSFRNTGMSVLPPAVPAWLPYDGGSVPAFGNGSESPMGGPVYRFSASNPSTTKFPAAYDGNFFAGEFGRRWIRRIVMNGGGTVQSINTFPWAGTQVMDMAFGPEGSLYVLDYGTGFFNGDQFSALYRIDHIPPGGGQAPVARASATPTSGPAPLTVQFSSAGSSDPEGGAITFAWDFDNNGTTDSTAANPSFTYTANGTFPAKLTVRDPTGLTGTANVTITVGNTAPTVTLTLPANGQVFRFGDAVPFQVTVTDPQDGTITCSRVRVDYVLGHDSHGHPITGANGCSGTIQTTVDGEHDANANIFGVFVATYTDNGGLTGTAQSIAQPEVRQAEHRNEFFGTQLANHTNAHGGVTVGFIDNNDWIAFTPYNLANVTSFRARVSSAGAGGTLELRVDSPTGALVGSTTVPVTGSWETFVDVTGAVTNPGGTRKLYLVFKGGAGALYDVDDFTFVRGSPPTESLLSQGRPTATSSVESATFPGANAVDGSLTTRWSSQFSDPQWISVDLGSNRTIRRVQLNWETAFGRAYQLQTSTDNATWTTRFSTTTGDGGVDNVTLATPVTGRYVRMFGTQRATVWGYSLFEFQVFGS